jgi:F-type H+-transporting ATPase subunit b
MATTETPAQAPAAPAGTHAATAAEGGHGSLPQLDSSHYPSQLLWLAISFGLLYPLPSRLLLPMVESAPARRLTGSMTISPAPASCRSSRRRRRPPTRHPRPRRAVGPRARRRMRNKLNTEVEAERNRVEAEVAARIAAAEAEIEPPAARRWARSRPSSPALSATSSAG